MPEGVSVWEYQTKKGPRWAFEVRSYSTGRKFQQRGFRSRADAMRHAKQARIDEQYAVPKVSTKPTVEQLIKNYIDGLQGAIREHSRANYKDQLERYVIPVIGKQLVEEIKEPVLSALLVELRKTGLRVSTVNTVRGRLIGLFTYAVNNELIGFNPAARTRVQVEYDVSKSMVQEALSADEARLMIQASKGTAIELFIALTLGMGLRKGEALGLKWSDVDLAQGLVRIERSRGQQRYLSSDGKVRSIECDGPTKTGASKRLLPLGKLALSALLAHGYPTENAPEGYLISLGQGLPMSLATLGREYRKLIRDNGLRHVRIHDLRHSAATIALEGNAPLEAVSQALGHSGIEITKKIYAPRVKILDLKFIGSLNLQLSEIPDSLETMNTELLTSTKWGSKSCFQAE